MFLGDCQRLVGIVFEEDDVEDLGGRVGRTVVVLAAGVDAAGGRVGRFFSRPYVGLHAMLHGGSEEGSPYRRFPVFAFGVAGNDRLETIRLGVTRPAMRGDE